jgi:hypothetical protein
VVDCFAFFSYFYYMVKKIRRFLSRFLLFSFFVFPASTNFKLEGFSFGNAGGGMVGSSNYGMVGNIGEIVGKTSGASAWYDQNWPYRVKLSIDAAKVDADLTDFPVYVNLANLPAEFHSHVNQTDSRDIRVTKADGVTELPREVVSNDELHFKYTGTMSGTTDTDIYIYYGNSGASDYAVSATYGAQNVWDSNYSGVWHFKEGSGASVIDSKNGHTATLQQTSNWITTGPVGNAYDFDGSTDGAIVANHSDFRLSTFTIEAWVRPNSPAPWSGIVYKGDAAEANYQFSPGTVATNFALDFGNGSGWHTLEISNTLTNLAWNYYVATMDDATNDQILYKNGSSVASDLNQTGVASNYSAASDVGIGIYGDGTGGRFHGSIDEVRISKVARSGTWISTDYNNQYSPSTFFKTFGGEEQYSSSGYSLGAGLAYIRQSGVPNAPILVNDGNYYNKLHLTLDNSTTMPPDTKFAVAISSDNWVTTNYVKNDMTVGGTLAMSDYLTYPVWGNTAGVYIVGLEVGTTYAVKVKSIQGQYTESGYSLAVAAATVSPTLSFDIDISATDIQTTPPYLIDFGDLYPGSVSTSTDRVWVSFETNATSGGSVFVYGQNGGLYSLSAGYTIPAISGNLAVLPNGFGAQGVGATQVSGGPLSIDSLYNGGDDIVGVTDMVVRKLMNSENSITTGRASFLVKAKSDNNVPTSSDYTETLTIIAAANF